MAKQNYNKRSERRVSQIKSPLEGAGIPPYVSDQVLSMKIRYACNSLNLRSCTAELPIAPYGVARTITTLDCPFKACRLAGFKLWCNYVPGVDIQNNTISATCVSRRTVRPIEWADTASYERRACIKKKFSKEEPMGWWYTTSIGETNPEITFVMPQGALLELDLCFILSDGLASPSCIPGMGLTIGKLYTNLLNVDLVCLSRVDSAVIII